MLSVFLTSATPSSSQAQQCVCEVLTAELFPVADNLVNFYCFHLEKILDYSGWEKFSIYCATWTNLTGLGLDWLNLKQCRSLKF